ncbi:hypothetical protein N7490_000334 [Penicillium lividum]|nr:hypothetical protein N7490_000334 [Penicillium lividum]
MYEQPYTINKFALTAAALARGFAKLSEQLAKHGEFHPQVPYFKFVPEVARRLESRNMDINMGEVPEDGMVRLGFAARPFTVALERLDLHFEARLNSALLHRSDKVRFHQRVNIDRNRFDVFEQTVGTLKVARHDIPDLPTFQVGGHETFPGREVVASCQRLDSYDRSQLG